MLVSFYAAALVLILTAPAGEGGDSESTKPDPPNTDAPKTDPPKADAPKADPPKADPPKADPPKTDPPNADAPTADPPKDDNQKADSPAKMDEGGTLFNALTHTILEFSHLNNPLVHGISLVNNTHAKEDMPKRDKSKKEETTEMILNEALNFANHTAQKKGLFTMKTLGGVIVPENFAAHDNIVLMNIFEGLVKERRKIQRQMMYHMVMVGLGEAARTSLAAYPIVQNVATFIASSNEKWGNTVEHKWIQHQEKMANYLFRLLQKKGMDPQLWKNKKMKIEYAHNKFAYVPVYRTYKDEPLPSDALYIYQNKAHMVKNFFV